MLELTPEQFTTAYLAAVQARKQAVLADLDFQHGFEAGLEAFECDAETRGHVLTFHQTCQTITQELDPQMLADEAYVARMDGHIANTPAFRSGFLAGWIYTYLAGLIPVTSPLVQTQPLAGVVIAFHPRKQLGQELL